MYGTLKIYVSAYLYSTLQQTRKYIRIITANVFLSFMLLRVLFFFNINEVNYTDFENPVFRFLFLAWVLFIIFGTFFWLFYFFWHWKISDFENGSQKTLWLVVLILGFPLFFIGHFAYYIWVYELKRGGIITVKQ